MEGAEFPMYEEIDSTVSAYILSLGVAARTPLAFFINQIHSVIASILFFEPNHSHQFTSSTKMQAKLITLAFAALAVAMPQPALDKRAALCPSLDTPLCCQLDVDGVLDATCASRMYHVPAHGWMASLTYAFNSIWVSYDQECF